jgi:hypothetical protein
MSDEDLLKLVNSMSSIQVASLSAVNLELVTAAVSAEKALAVIAARAAVDAKIKRAAGNLYRELCLVLSRRKYLIEAEEAKLLLLQAANEVKKMAAEAKVEKRIKRKSLRIHAAEAKALVARPAAERAYAKKRKHHEDRINHALYMAKVKQEGWDKNRQAKL